jgi:adenosine deaminase
MDEVISLESKLDDAFRRTAAECRASLALLPKTDLHAHGLLSMSLAEFQRIAGAEVEPPPMQFTDFDQFQRYLRARLVPEMVGVERVRALLEAALQRMIDEGVVYTELSVDFMLPEFLGIAAEEFAEMLESLRDKMIGRIAICFEGGIHRETPLDALDRTFDAIVATGCFGSIDLYGDETSAPASAFRHLYAKARDRGLKLKAHAGEQCGADFIRETIRSLPLDAIQHGISAANDPRLMDELIERDIVLHVCPTSNVKLGIVRDYGSHPIRALVEHGVRVTVNTDDYLVFGAGVCDELINLHQKVGLSARAIAAIVECGLEENRDYMRSQADTKT